MKNNYKNQAIDMFFSHATPQSEDEIKVFFKYLMQHHPKVFVDACTKIVRSKKALALTAKQREIGELGKTLKIQAIKEYRAEYSVDLKEAKNEVERIVAILQES